MTKRSPEELDTQVPENQWAVDFQLFASLLHFGSGWFANHALQRTRRVRRGLQSLRRVAEPGSLIWLNNCQAVEFCGAMATAIESLWTSRPI